MAGVEKLAVVLQADIKNLQRNLKTAEVVVGQFSGRVSKGLALAMGPAGVAGIGAAAGAGLLAFAKNAVQAADAIGDAAQAAGLGAESLQRWQAAAKLSDIEAEQFTAAAGRMSKMLGEAAGGNKEAARTFESLGVSIRNADGSLRSNDEVLRDVIQRVGAFGTQAERTAAATDIFGKAVGPQMAAFAAQGMTAIDELRGSTAVLSDEQVEAASRINDSWERLVQTLDVGLKSALLEVARFMGSIATATLPELNNQIADLEARVSALKASANYERSPRAREYTASFEKELETLKQARSALLRKQPGMRPTEGGDPNAPTYVSKEAAAAAVREAEKLAKEETARRKRIKEEAYRNEYEELLGQYKREEEATKAGDERAKRAQDAFEEEQIRRTGEIEERNKQMAESLAETFADVAANGSKAFDRIKQKAIAGLAEIALKWAMQKFGFGNLGGGVGAGGGAGGFDFGSLLGGALGGFGGGGTGAGGTSAGGPKFGGMIGSTIGSILFPGVGGPIGGMLGGMLGFANGGSFRVGGRGGVDSQTVAFRATPGEMVDVRTPGQARGAGGGGALRVELHIEKDMTTTEERGTGPNGEENFRVYIRNTVRSELGKGGSLSAAANAATGTKRPAKSGIN